MGQSRLSLGKEWASRACLSAKSGPVAPVSRQRMGQLRLSLGKEWASRARLSAKNGPVAPVPRQRMGQSRLALGKEWASRAWLSAKNGPVAPGSPTATLPLIAARRTPRRPYADDLVFKPSLGRLSCIAVFEPLPFPVTYQDAQHHDDTSIVVLEGIHYALRPRKNGCGLYIYRISPASASVSPFQMWFDACLLLQKHPQVAVEFIVYCYNI